MPVSFQLGAYRLVGGAGIFGGAIDEVQQHTTALDMSEEAVAEADAFVGAFDQTRNIGEHKFATVDVDHPELRMQRRKWIIGNLGLGRAHGGKEGRLAGVRQADDAGVGNELEPQPNRKFDAELTWIGATRRAIGRTLEVGIAEAAIAAVGKHGALPDLGEIGQKRYPVLVVDLRADRHFENRIGAVGAVTILAHAGPAVGGGKMLLVAIIDERVEAV